MSQYKADSRHAREKRNEGPASMTCEAMRVNANLKQKLTDRIVELESVYGGREGREGLGLYERVDALERRMGQGIIATDRPRKQTQVAFETSAARATGESASSRTLSLNDTAGLFAAADVASRALRVRDSCQEQSCASATGDKQRPLLDQAANIPEAAHVCGALGWDKANARLLVKELADAVMQPDQCQKCVYCTRTPFNHPGRCNQFRLLTTAERVAIELGARRGEGNAIVSTLRDRMTKIDAAKKAANNAPNLNSPSAGLAMGLTRRNRFIGPHKGMYKDNGIRGGVPGASSVQHHRDECALLIPPSNLDTMSNNTLLDIVEAAR